MSRIKGFLLGIARVFDYSSSINHTIPLPKLRYHGDQVDCWTKDGMALAGDWRAIGGDVGKAMNSLRSEYEQELTKRRKSNYN